MECSEFQDEARRRRQAELSYEALRHQQDCAECDMGMRRGRWTPAEGEGRKAEDGGERGAAEGPRRANVLMFRRPERMRSARAAAEAPAAAEESGVHDDERA